MHGGGLGAFNAQGEYLPAKFFPNSLDEETIALAGQINEPGLIQNIRDNAHDFRFMMPSLCDHDLYSGVGEPDLLNPYPDENDQPRSADGLLALISAIDFTRQQLETTKTFAHGTSAGSAGSFTTAYMLERLGRPIQGIVMDSAVISAGLGLNVELTKSGEPRCVDYMAELDLVATKSKIGPALAPHNLPERLIAADQMHTPIFLLWNIGDPTFCGQADVDGEYASDLFFASMRDALETYNPGGCSERLRACINTANGQACTLHSPTKFPFDFGNPPGDQLHNGLDYNAHIDNWVNQVMAGC